MHWEFPAQSHRFDPTQIRREIVCLKVWKLNQTYKQFSRFRRFAAYLHIDFDRLKPACDTHECECEYGCWVSIVFCPTICHTKYERGKLNFQNKYELWKLNIFSTNKKVQFFSMKTSKKADRIPIIGRISLVSMKIEKATTKAIVFQIISIVLTDCSGMYK